MKTPDLNITFTIPKFVYFINDEFTDKQKEGYKKHTLPVPGFKYTINRVVKNAWGMYYIVLNECTAPVEYWRFTDVPDNVLSWEVVDRIYKEEQLFEIECRKYFKKFAKYKKDQYSISGLKGKHTMQTIKHRLIEKKIACLTNFAKQKGALNICYSKTTKSIYFLFDNERYRISDHWKRTFKGTDVTIYWDTDFEQVKNIFTNILNKYLPW